FADPKPLTFEDKIRPIFKAHCFECHGEGRKLKGGLDVRLRRLVEKGGESGPAFNSGKHRDSLLCKRVASKEMPPGKKKLTPEEIALIGRWIDEGAKTARPEPDKISPGFFITAEEQAYWAFQPIRRPPLPRIRQAEPVRTPIDAFVLARLEDKSL